MTKRNGRLKLKLDPKNARRHTRRNQEMIRESLEAVGAFRSIAADGDGIIRAGNETFQQAQALGLKLKPIVAKPNELVVVVRPDLRGKKALQAALYDNRTGELSEWDTDVLAGLPDDILSALWDTAERTDLGLGLDEPESLRDAEPKLDKATQLQRKWGTAPGQIWVIPSRSMKGKAHRLACGDSTNAEHVARLMAGEPAALVATDPPYLVDYTGANRPGQAGKDWSALYHEIDIKDVDGFIRGFVTTAMAHTKDNAAWFVWHASQRASLVERLLTECGLLVHQPIIWVKPVATFGYAKYRWAHEAAFFCWKQKHPPYFTPGWFKQNQTSVWEMDWEGRSRTTDDLHPTQKPIELFARPMRNHTHPNDVCYEPFSGSGSQLVAAENVKRICYASELEPGFVAVSLQRMVDAFGLEPQLAPALRIARRRASVDHDRPKARRKAKAG